MVKEAKIKANWDPVVAQIFCEICAEEVQAGNRSTIYLNDTGYKNVQLKFFEKTRRAYIRKQFKNRWDAMKTLYLAWKHFKGKAIGLGWDDEKKPVTTDDKWWKETIEGNKVCGSFREGPLPYLKELEIMFANAHVDGKSSFMPGVDAEIKEDEEDEEVVEVEEVEEVVVTPLTKVRGAGKCPLGVGPSPKMKKSCMQKDFKCMVDHYTTGKSSVASAAVNMASEIEAIMAKVVECGAHEGVKSTTWQLNYLVKLKIVSSLIL